MNENFRQGAGGAPRRLVPLRVGTGAGGNATPDGIAGGQGRRPADPALDLASGDGAIEGRPSPCTGREAVVVGMGAFSPLGRNCAEMRQALLDGRDSIGKVTHFDACRFVGELASSFGEDIPVEMDADARSWMDRATLLTVEAYREAIRHAGVNLWELDPERIGVCLGSSHSGLVRTEEVARNILRQPVGEDPSQERSRRRWSRTAPRSSSA